ncbi:MAG: lysylphosphatidylglycerol synthase transmembrane domain-containing protein [Pseudomonadota bacterium]
MKQKRTLVDAVRPTAPPAKTDLPAAVLWTVAGAALGYLGLSLWVGWRAVLAAVLQAGPAVLLALLSLSLLNYFLRFARWARYLALLEVSVPWRINLNAYFSGFALTTSPGKLGESIRSILLKPHGVPPLASLAAFFAERASDLLSVLLLTTLGAWTYAPARWPLACALLLLCGILLLAQRVSLITWISVWASARSSRLARLTVHLCNLVLQFRRCFTLPALAMGLSFGLAAWFAEGLGFWFLLNALGHPLALTQAVFIYAFAMLIGGLSFLPGGLGSSEATMIALLTLNGLPEVSAISATLICRLATLWFAVALGAILLLRRKK